LPAWLDQTILHDPIVQTAALPFVVSLVVALLIRLIGGAGRSPALAAAGMVFGFAAAYGAILGAPSLEPRGATQKIIYIAIGGLAVGLLADLWRVPRWMHWLALLLWPSVALAWLAENLLAQATRDTWLLLAPIWISICVVLARLRVAARRDIDCGAFLLVFCLGLGFVALLGRSAVLAQFCLALAAAIGGFLVLNWPKPRFVFGSAALVGAGGTAAALAAILALFTGVNKWALGTLTLVFLSDPLFHRLLPSAGPLRALALTTLAALPALAAIAIAYYVVHDSM